MLVSRSNLNVQSSCALACPPPKTIFRAGGGSRAAVECFHEFPQPVHEDSPLLRKNQHPLIRLRHLLPHAEKRVGEKDSRQTRRLRFHLGCEKWRVESRAACQRASDKSRFWRGRSSTGWKTAASSSSATPRSASTSSPGLSRTTSRHMTPSKRRRAFVCRNRSVAVSRPRARSPR